MQFSHGICPDCYEKVRKDIEGRPLVTEWFFEDLFSDLETVDQFEAAVERFRVAAMWLYGNFKFAHRLLGTADQEAFRNLIAEAEPKTPPSGRLEFNEIEDIPDGELLMLGYISSGRVIAIDGLMRNDESAQIPEGAQLGGELVADVPREQQGVFRLIVEQLPLIEHWDQRAWYVLADLLRPRNLEHTVDDLLVQPHVIDQAGISILPSRNTPMLHPRAGCSRVSNRRPSSPLHPRAVTRPGLESTGNGSVPPHFSDTSPR